MMNDAYFSGGDRSKPLAIFIHGMGMDARMWAEPEQARVLGGKYPLSILLENMELKSSFHDLMKMGFPVLAWSQKRPAGPVRAAVEELKGIVSVYQSQSHAGIILIGHSRGGLIARLFIQQYDAPVREIITIAAPHKGSSMAKLAVYVSPITTAVKVLLDLTDRDVHMAMHRVLAFLSGDEIKELLPGSGLLKSLSGNRKPGIRIVSIGGTDPALVKIGNTSLSALISSVMPDSMLPDEMREGRGDGFVSAGSAVYPEGDEHRDFHVHHAGLVFDRDVRDYVAEAAEKL